MWLVVSYDISSQEARAYRKLRKELQKAGFSFPQKSLGWKWVHSSERAESILRNIRSAAPASGHLLAWRIPDHVFAEGQCRKNGELVEMPDIPTPWIVA